MKDEGHIACAAEGLMDQPSLSVQIKARMECLVWLRMCTGPRPVDHKQCRFQRFSGVACPEQWNWPVGHRLVDRLRGIVAAGSIKLNRQQRSITVIEE